MFDQTTVRAVGNIAARLNVEPAALLAVAQVESGGVAFAAVAGRQEPLIRWEGHYFDRRLSGDARSRARREGLASPKAGAIANPNAQAPRWALLARASAIDHQAANESVSWGLGQVMGAHWAWLGFPSVDALVDLCRRDVVGQIDVMAQFIERAGLAGALRTRDWRSFARGYNGPSYAQGRYHTKMATAYARWAGKATPATTSDPTVRTIQERLVVHGFKVVVDGVRGAKTTASIVAFQRAKKLKPDGIVGSATFAALARAPAV